MEEGTPILTPKGPVAVEDLRPGDEVVSFSEGRFHTAVVRTLTSVRPADIIEVIADRRRLRLTAEHPVMVKQGEFRHAGSLKAGDILYVEKKGELQAARVQNVSRVPATLPAYNLLVSPGGTFLSHSFVVHNKGCFLPDSLILRPDGTETPISRLRKGDQLLAFTHEKRVVRTRVRDIIRHEADEYMLLQTDRTTLRVTTEHPFYVGQGTYRTVETLRPGDTIYAWDGETISQQRIVSLQKVHERTPVFNLRTDNPNTFFAGRVAVHNKGGCFPSGTKIATGRGYVTIESLTAGDEVLAVAEDGRALRTNVRDLFIARSGLFHIKTDDGMLVTTLEHPIATADGRFTPAGDLKPGDRILSWKNGRLIPIVVREAFSGESGKLVFNLEVGQPHTFVAENVLVHNKGGGGGSRSFGSRSSSSRASNSRSSGGDGTTAIIMLSAFFSVFILILIISAHHRRRSKSENLDFVYGRRQIDRKANKTEKLLSFLAREDPSVAPHELRERAESTFRKLQECWEARDYTPMKPLLTESLFAQHTAQLQGMIRNHEINRIEDLKVEQIDLVNIRYTENQKDREFTALITASCRDYYVDDRTGSFVRGDSASARFQEFWTFEHSDHGWVLREIEQSGESDVLKDENFVEMLTDETVQRIYGEAAAEGTAGPWLDEKTEGKADRIDRLLNFLVQTDKMWNRQRMLGRAREVFLSVYLARESGNPDLVPTKDLFPEVAESLREQLREWRAKGVTVEYRNICVRKVDLILLRNYADRAKDEYCVRIYAHAQKITRKNGNVVSQQPYATPFEEYWTLGRLDEEWKLKEVLPPGRARKVVGEENVNEESSAEELQWYYRQSRAR